MRYLFLSCFIFINLQATIVEHDRLRSIFNYLKDNINTLVIVDIDNTLAAPKTSLGSDEWFSYLIAQKMNQGLSIDYAVNSILPTYFHVQFTIPLIPLEDDTPYVIKELQQKQVPVIALTARSIYIADRTVQQLRDIDINFIFPRVIQEAHLTMPTHIPCMFKCGIMFSGNNDKGNILIELFKELAYWPTMVIFVDDKHKNLQSVEQALEQYNINFVGIRYSGSDAKVKSFDPQEAEKQLEVFYDLLT